MIDKIESLVNEIEMNIKIIDEKSCELSELKIKETMQVIDLARKYLVFEEIENIVAFSSTTHYSNLTTFSSLCKHAIKIGEYISGTKKMNHYMNEKKGTYELWLLWNNEFCVTRAFYEKTDTSEEPVLCREITEYGRCAFNRCNNELIWDLGEIERLITANLENNLKEKQNTRYFLETSLS